ncbi:MAG: DUF4230 domain-containing protein [Anaerolineales bacterium]|nr:DUF4230 domain-containing protein [Anaerolineales bacterium]
MDKSKDNKILYWVLAIGILIILGYAAFSIVSILKQSTQQAQQALQPVSDLTNHLATQVAQVLEPTPTVIVDPVTIIHQVRSLARLETIQYSIEKVITAESGQGSLALLLGDRLLFVAHGIVIAGIDLEKLGPGDLIVEENILYVQLPEAEIYIATLDNENSYVYDRDKGLLTKGDVNLETTARRVAEREIENSAVEDGILGIAQQNAESYLYRLLLEIGGYDDVIFIDPTQEN